MRIAGKKKAALLHSAERFAFLLKDIQIAISNRLNLIKEEQDFLSINQKNKLEEIYSFFNRTRRT